MIRFLHKCYARVFGYFWLPSPICGENFGGHELLNSAWGPGVLAEDGRAYCTCPKQSCHDEAQRRFQAVNGFRFEVAP